MNKRSRKREPSKQQSNRRSQGNGHVYNIGEVKIGKIVSSPQVFNYYYMSPNYNLKLSNLNPNATVDLKNFESNSRKAETIVHNMVCPSQNVIKLSENKTSLKVPPPRLHSRKLKTRKKRHVGSKTSSRNPKAKAKKFNKPRISNKIPRMLGLDVAEKEFSQAIPKIGEKPLTPSFFKKKQLEPEMPEYLLSREISCLNNSHQPQKVPMDGEELCGQLADVESSVSIPLNKSSLMSKEPLKEDFVSCTLGESPLIRKQKVPPKEMLYSSLAFSISSSLDTSSKFLKLLPKEQPPQAKLKKFGIKKNLNKTSNMIKNKKDKIKRLKSQRKDQIRWLKKEKGIRGIKKYYNQVKQKSRKFTQQTQMMRPLNKIDSAKGISYYHFSVRASKEHPLDKDPNETQSRDARATRVDAESRNVSSMRKTTGTTNAKPTGPDFIDRQLMSVQTSKVHSRLFENLLKDSKQPKPKQSFKEIPDNVNIFKQRMSSNVDLNSKKYFLEEKHVTRQINRLHKKQNDPLTKEERIPKERKNGGAKETKLKMRKNTSLDLVLKKKSIKFMGMRKEILKSIKKEVKNIYRLSSPSLKNFENSINKFTSSVATRNKPSKKNSGREKSSQKTLHNRTRGQMVESQRRITGSLDLKEAGVCGSSVQKKFEDSLRTFKGSFGNCRQFAPNEASSAAEQDFHSQTIVAFAEEEFRIF